jgi:hypothetical protein
LGGFGVLLAMSGEALTYAMNNMTASVRAVVNRKVVDAKDAVASRDGKMNFDLTGMTIIEALRSAIAEPAVGASFADSIGFSHRVRKVETTDITWVCYCTQSKTA